MATKAQRALVFSGKKNSGLVFNPELFYANVFTKSIYFFFTIGKRMLLKYFAA